MKKFIQLAIYILCIAPFALAQVNTDMSGTENGLSKNPYVTRVFTDENGKEIEEIIVPGRPPENYRAPVAKLPDPDNENANVLANVPAFDWSFGCSATSAAMIASYYDRTGYDNIYTGPTNGGVMPMNNSYWPAVVINGETRKQCPLSATHEGLDGRSIKGHVDDYWYMYGSEEDPYYGNWTQHEYGDCTADYMGTNQFHNFGVTDGATRFYSYLDGSPLYDYTGCEPNERDGCHGFKLFLESRGYNVQPDGNYSQRIYGYEGNTLGFTWQQYKAEIDAGRPVLIQIIGHTMVGYGYDESGGNQLVYIHDTWDYNDHTMEWGGTYADMQHYGVVVMMLEPVLTAFNPPRNFSVDNQGYATWEAPQTQTESIIAHHDGYSGMGIGTNNAASWICAARFDETDMETHYGSILNAVNFHIHEDFYSYVELRIYEGGSSGDPGTLIYAQDVTDNVLINEWTTIPLTSPIALQEGNEYWIGYYIDATGGYPSSSDGGPAIPGKGDWMYFNGSWIEISTEFNLNYNWRIEGVVLTTGDAGDEKHNQKQILSHPPHEMITAGTPPQVSSLLHQVPPHPDKRQRDLLGYNVYLDGSLVENTTNLYYQFAGLNPGQTYNAGVTAIYDEGESEMVTDNFTFMAVGDTIYVKQDGTGNATTIQGGIDLAQNGQVVLVYPGTYNENISFSGKLITVGSLFLTTQDESYISQTTIDGGQAGVVVSFSYGEDAGAMLTGFTITNGDSEYGGGIYCYYSSPTISYLHIVDNSSTHGGGIYCRSGLPSISFCLLADNTAEITGGALNIQNCTGVELNRLTIANNNAQFGGALMLTSSSVTIDNSILWGNQNMELYFNNYYDPNYLEVNFCDAEGGQTAFQQHANNGTLVWGTGNLNANPLFANATSGDYSLASGSPCIDAGDPAAPLDPDGTRADIGAIYYVQQIDLNAEFSADVTAGGAPLTVQFTDASEGNPSSWEWDFDNDGTVDSYDQNPEFIYTETGVYTVSLTISDSQSSDTETKTGYIFVTNGFALHFDGEDDIATFDGFTYPTGDLTLEVWIRPMAIGAISEIMCGINNSNSSTFQLRLNTDGAFLYGESPDWTFIATEPCVELNQWQHVAVVKESGNCSLYVNGQLKAYNPLNEGVTPTEISIGGRSWNMDRFFNGDIDEVRIWSVARTQTELSENMNNYFSGSESGLLGYWKANEGAGQIAYDETGNNHNFQLGTTAGSDVNDPAWNPTVWPYGFFADFTADATLGYAPLTVQFTDASVGNPSSWEWDFDNDGNVDSFEQNPEFVYTETGVYSVSLTISNGGGSVTETKTHYITVLEDPGSVSGVTATQRTDGSKIVDITYDLAGPKPSYNVVLEVSFDSGENYDEVQEVTGDLENVIPADDLLLTWDAGSEFPDGFFSETMRMRVSAVSTEWNCGDILTDPRDGQIYRTVQIGEQCWMAENLNVGERIDGSGEMTDNGTIEKYCYGDNPANCDTYGGLYQWDEMMQYTTTAGVKGICPEGWHLPTDDEWKILEGTVDSQYPVGDPVWDNLGWRGLDAGANLKEAGTTHWNSPNDDATNSSGFTALPGGKFIPGGFFYNMGNSGIWWSSQDDAPDALIRLLSNNDAEAIRFSYNKSDGYSVRCLKDETTPPTTYNLILESEPAEAGTVEGAGQYEEGEEISVSATENSGWEFVNWTDANGIVSEVASFTYTMPAEDVTLTANFIEEGTGFNCGDIFTDSRDGQQYETVQIGDQCWMAENLNIGERIDGSEDMTDNGTIEKYCYDDNPANCETYGGLYQWDEMMGYTTNAAVQGICPDGWHLPTDAEWCILEQEVDPTITCGSTGDRGIDGGGKLKESGTTHWNSPNYGATNSSGFTALPGGGRGYYDGSFYNIADGGYWWSSSQKTTDPIYAWSRSLYKGNSRVNRSSPSKTTGYSVRCLKDGNMYNLNLQANPIEAGEIYGSGQYIEGVEITITATPNPDWQFVNWTDANGVVSEVADFIYTMPAEHVTLTANFIEEQPGFNCGDPLIDSRDGQSYQTVQIGNQCWMAENLNIGTHITGSNVQTDNGIIEKYCSDHNPANCQTYGGLYEWEEMMEYTTTPGAQGICPERWHIPTDAEWKILEGTVDSYYPVGDFEWDKINHRGYDVGDHLKSTTGWNNNANGTDLYGFSALPGGKSQWNGSGGYISFSDLGDMGFFWASDNYSSANPWHRRLSGAQTWHAGFDLGYGLSVRCVRDETAPIVSQLILNTEPLEAGTVGGAGQYEAGEKVSVTATANPGWEFVNWTDADGEVSTDASFTYTMPAVDVTLTANFIEEGTGFNCGFILTDSRDGQQYETVQIGDQCWMAENLAYIPEVSPSSQGNNTVPYYYVYDYEGTNVAEAKATANYQNYGALYNWPASIIACPSGWHLPSDAEWTVLTDFLGGSNVAGGKMKSTRTAPDPHPRWKFPNYGATNSSGFTGLPGGFRYDNDGIFNHIGSSGFFWSSTEVYSTDAVRRSLDHSNDFVGDTGYTKGIGLSVRCVRD